MKNAITKSNSYNFLKITFILISLIFVNNVNALEEKIDAELQPLAPLPSSISGKENVRNQITKWMQQGKSELGKGPLALGEGQLPDGRTRILARGTAAISAPITDKNWMDSRYKAFMKADLIAKSECAKFQELKIENELESEYLQPAPKRLKSEAEQFKREGLIAEGASKIAKAIHNDVSAKSESKTLQTASLYGEKLITNIADSEIRKMGLDPNKPIDGQTVKEIINTQNFKQAVRTLAEAECSAIQTLVSFESVSANGKGEVGVITIWTEKLQVIASGMMTGNFDLVPPAKPGLPLPKQVNIDLRTLLTTIGTQIVTDERGQYVLLSYAQASPRSDDSQSVDISYRIARTLAESQIRQFMGELIAVRANLDDKEENSKFDNNDFSYKNESDYYEKIRSYGQQAKISGIQPLKEWETRHPSNNAPVVGVVLQWKPSAAKVANQLRQMSKGTSKQSLQGTNSQNSSSSRDQAKSEKPPTYELQEYVGEGRSSSDF